MSLTVSSLLFMLSAFTFHTLAYAGEKKDKITLRFSLLEVSQTALKHEMDLKFKELKNEITQLKDTGSVGKDVRRLQRKYQKVQRLLAKLSDQLGTVQEENKILKGEIATLKKVIVPQSEEQDVFPDTTSTTPYVSAGKGETDNPIATPKPMFGLIGTEKEGSQNGTVKPSSESVEGEETDSLLKVTSKPVSGSVGTEKEGSLNGTAKPSSESGGDEETESPLKVTPEPVSGSVARESGVTGSVTKGRTGRLLVAPWGHTEPFQVNLSDYSVSPYSLKISDYQSIVYVPTIQSLIVTGIAPFNMGNIIYVSRIDSSDFQPLVRNYASHAATVDEERELIIVSTIRPRKTVSSLKYDGSDLTTIADLSAYHYPYGVALDNKLKRIYVCAENKLLSMTYNGNDVRVMHSGKEIRTVAADMFGRVLYFNDETRLMKYSLESGQTVTIGELPFQPWNFLHARKYDGSNNLYVSSFRGRMVGVLQLDNNSSYIPILPACSPCRYVSAICLIP